jgi:AcrR family transcriptional regulator
MDLVARRRHQILAAALPVFARNGYRRAKVDEVADSLKVGKGTIYRYFENKKQLFIAVFESLVRLLMETMRVTIEKSDSPPEKVASAVKIYFNFFEGNREFIEIAMQMRSEFPNEHQEIAVASFNEYIERIKSNLRRGIEMGLFREMDVDKTAEAVSATLQGVMMSFYCRKGTGATQMPANNGDLLTDRIEAVTELLLKGLTVKE